MSNHKTSRQTVEAVALLSSLAPEQQAGVNELCRAVQKHVIEIYVPGNGLAVVRMPTGAIPDEATVSRCKEILAALQKEERNNDQGEVEQDHGEGHGAEADAVPGADLRP